MGTTHYFFSTTATSKLYNEELESSFSEAVLDAVLNNKSIPDALIASLLTGFSVNMDDYFDYAKAGQTTSNIDEGYIYGLPAIYVGYGSSTIDWTWETNYGPAGFQNNVKIFNKVATTYGIESYPIVPIRHNKVNVNSNKSSAWYKSTDTLLQKIPMDVNELVASVASNPDINDIMNAWFQISANIYDENIAITRYLYLLVEYLHTISPVKSSWYYSTRNGGTPTINIINIDEADYNTQVLFNYTHTWKSEGVIGSVGTVTKNIVYIPNSNFYQEICWNKLCWERRNTYFNSYMDVSKQVSATKIVHYRIHGLAILTGIIIDGIPKGTMGYISWEASKQREMNLPVLPHLLSKLNDKDAEQLLYNGMQIKVTAGKHTIVPDPKTSGWDSFLNAAISIIGIVLTPVTLGASISLTAVVLNLVKIAVVNVLTDYALEWLLEKGVLPDQLAKILLVVAAAAIVMNKAGAFGSGMKGLPWAEELVKFVTNFTEVSMQKLKDDITLVSEQQSILDDQRSIFQAEYDERLNELEAQARNLRKDYHSINSFILINDNYFNPNESPTDFIDRTIHNGNPGVKALDAIEYYVTGALALPEANSGDDAFAV